MPTPREALARTLEHFGPLSEACLEALMDLAIPRRLDKGAFFARAGQSPRSLGFILDGVFRAFLTTDNGTEYNKTFFGTGTFIVALTSLVSGQTNRIDIQALTPADLLVFDFQRFTRLYDQHRDLERIARRMVEFEWVKKEQREIALVLDDATTRYTAFHREHPDLENQIPQYHIASYLGITPIHLSRIRGRGQKKRSNT